MQPFVLFVWDLPVAFCHYLEQQLETERENWPKDERRETNLKCTTTVNKDVCLPNFKCCFGGFFDRSEIDLSRNNVSKVQIFWNCSITESIILYKNENFGNLWLKI